MKALDASIDFALGLISSFDLRGVSPTCKGHVASVDNNWQAGPPGSVENGSRTSAYDRGRLKPFKQTFAFLKPEAC
ncbi:hypothetical protein GGD66_006391 [Bradyrhizobium sp. CIR48]|nr:hypothetical protein [Bradyrhizobium sp. CIR48]